MRIETGAISTPYITDRRGDWARKSRDQSELPDQGRC